MNIYPAIDMMGGCAVRLKQGRAEDVTRYGDPAGLAAGFKAAGAEYLHMVDLDAAFTGSSENKPIALKIAAESGLKVQLGGGIRDMAAIDAMLGGGISRVILGTIAIKQPELVKAAIDKFGCERIVVGIDARDGVVAVKGWVEGSGVSAVELAARMRDIGVKYIVYTDIARDGMLSGPNLESTRRMVEVGGLSIIASGGVSGYGDIGALSAIGCEGMIIGKAMYEGRIDLKRALEMAR